MDKGVIELNAEIPDGAPNLDVGLQVGTTSKSCPLFGNSEIDGLSAKWIGRE
jgi:hypothetical protein